MSCPECNPDGSCACLPEPEGVQVNTKKIIKPKAVKSNLDQVVTCVICQGSPKLSEVFKTEIGYACLRHPGISELKRASK